MFFYLCPLWPEYVPYFSPLFFVTLTGFIIGKLVWLYCSDNLQNSIKPTWQKIVDCDISNKKIVISYFFHIAHPYVPITFQSKEEGWTVSKDIPIGRWAEKQTALLFSWQRMRAEMNSSSPLSMLPMGRGRALSYSITLEKQRNGLREELGLEMKDSWSHIVSLPPNSHHWIVIG